MAVIAVAVAVIGAVILLTGGVVAGSEVPGTLSFFGVTVHTTSAQIFLTGAICTWALLAAAWLLTMGIRRSRQRGVQLASLRGQLPGRDHRPPRLVDSAEFADGGPFANLLGFATRGNRSVAERARAGRGGDGGDAGQDAAEQPLRGQ
ncbi:hypothetical protein [Actinocrinis sp.]|uniref:hypothetical protein n=1 Tax=Actinocrinis sp. TaxID=1920516 RepID=UPI002C8A33EA|nr:hypothetical protein [Actinocrinis sp.]HXR71507.1 hypothetical protein [Actinocrinis sp.]